MKKIWTFLCICCLFCSLLFVCPVLAAENETDTAGQTAAGTSDQTAVSETETQTPEPVILPTDQVSTEDIILYSSACCVMDADTGEILYHKNMDDQHYPASITKVLTGLLLIENAQLDETITFSRDCWNGLNYYSDMNIGILDGEQLSVEAALHAILLSSANEVCNGAAEYVSGSVSAFCDLMNERASQLGCTNTHFANPNGLHSKDHYTSAHDMALIAREAIQNPTFRKITGSYDYTVTSTNLRPEGFVLSHKHQMLMYSNYHYDACIGGKTGYTEEARNTLVTYAEKNGMTLVCVVMENADGHIYPDTIQALDYCFDHYEALTAGTDDVTAAAAAAGWPSLPFAGFDIRTLSYVSDHTGDIVIPKGSTPDSLTADYASAAAADTAAANSAAPTADTAAASNAASTADTVAAGPVAANLAPYRSLLQPLGALRYLSADGQTVGGQPLYTSMSDLHADGTADSDTATVSGSADASGSTDTDTSRNRAAADTAQASTEAAAPTFIQLQDQDDAADGIPADEKTALQYLTDFAMAHLTYVLPAAIFLFVILTFLIIWLRQILKRRRHRRNFEKLRQERIKKAMKNR